MPQPLPPESKIAAAGGFPRLERDDLLRALSHDMRANLSLLEASLRQLKQSYANGASSGMNDGFSHVDACLRESKRYLDDLALLGRIGKVDMEPTRVDVNVLVAEVLYEQSALVEQRRIRTTVQPGLPDVWCHPGRLKQIFTNLVRNAALHGCDPREGAIEIGTADRLPATPADRFIWLRVHDNGPGVARHLAEEIFLPGKRLPGTIAEGSGLGLAIVRKLVEHYGGTIGLESGGGPGTAFVLSLPRPVAARPALRRPFHHRGAWGADARQGPANPDGGRST